jgi:hypothetical protein
VKINFDKTKGDKMNKEVAQKHIEANLKVGDLLIGFFYATEAMKLGMFALIGPLAALGMKFYYVAVTKNGLTFHRLNMMGKFSNSDAFSYDEIEKVKIGQGWVQRPMKFKFKNGRVLNLKAQLKGVEKVAKLTEDVQQYLEKNIPAES